MNVIAIAIAIAMDIMSALQGISSANEHICAGARGMARRLVLGEDPSASAAKWPCGCGT